MSEPAIDLNSRRRICAAVRIIKPFSALQEANSKRLIEYTREHHMWALVFYANHGQAVAKAFEEQGRVSELVEFEDRVHQLSQGDLEEAYRYYRDRFHGLYTSAFPGAIGPRIELAHKHLLEERSTEARSSMSGQGQRISDADQP